MKRIYFIIIMAVALLSSCKMQTSIPYTVANGYFQNNNVKTLPKSVFKSQSEFDQCFGMAAVMGEDGMPTTIDFSKNYVIAVSKPETDVETNIAPVSLKSDTDGKLTFQYKVTTGAKHSYTTKPCLLILVSNTHAGDVVLKETK